MKKVKFCFGRYGEIDCLGMMCESKEKCASCYFKWYLLRRERKLREKVRDYIEKYCRKHNLQIVDNKKLKGGKNVKERKFI
jgi:hypothetical protein